jgi:hypothetical protein
MIIVELPLNNNNSLTLYTIYVPLAISLTLLERSSDQENMYVKTCV